MSDLVGVGALVVVELIVLWLLVSDPDVSDVLLGVMLFVPWLVAAAFALWRGLDAGYRLGPLSLSLAQ